MEQSMSRVGRCIDNGPTEGFLGIIKTEMYQMYEITNEESLRFAITDYIRFYSEERPQDRYHCKTPLEVRMEALSSEHPAEYLIPRNKRIEKYKKMVCIEKRPHILYGRSSAPHFRYLTCLFDRGISGDMPCPGWLPKILRISPKMPAISSQSLHFLHHLDEAHPDITLLFELGNLDKCHQLHTNPVPELSNTRLFP